jgi:periplasmic protein TonB
MNAGKVSWPFFVLTRATRFSRAVENVFLGGFLLQTAHLNESLEFSEFCEPVEDHGLGCFGRRSLSRHKRLWQSIILSISFHLAVISIFVLAHKSSVNVGSPWLEVRLVSLGGGEVAGGSGEGGGLGERSAMAGPVPEIQPSVELLPPEQKQEINERPKEKEPKPVVKQAVMRPRPAGKPKEIAPSNLAQSSVCPIEALSPPAPQSDHGSAEPVSGNADSANGFAESARGGGAGGGPHGRGEHGGRGGGVVDAEFGAANGPRFAHRIMPQYPRVARQLGKEAVVILRVIIDESGRPIAVEAVKKAGGGFDEEAVRAVKESLFHPARKGGHPVICRAILPIRFQLKGSE